LVCSDTVGTFAKNMMDLERTVVTMILESLGVREEHVDAHHESVAHNVRLSHYGTLSETGPADVSMQVHRDCSGLTTVVQHGVEGLEVQMEDGSLVAVTPEPDTVAGEMLTVATNGRVPACVHRVRTPSNRERLSVLFVSMPKDGISVRPLDELVDGDDPAAAGGAVDAGPIAVVGGGGGEEEEEQDEE
jgi:isopenicillin N synthase-like dioxygenase